MNEINPNSTFSLMVRHPTQNILNFSKLHINGDCQLNVSGDGPYFYGMFQPDGTVRVIFPNTFTSENGGNESQPSSCSNFFWALCKTPCYNRFQNSTQYWLSVAPDKSLLVSTSNRSLFYFSEQWAFVIEDNETCSFNLRPVEICNNETNKNTIVQEWILNSYNALLPTNLPRIDTKIYAIFNTTLEKETSSTNSNKSSTETVALASSSSGSHSYKKKYSLKELLWGYLFIFAAICMLP